MNTQTATGEESIPLNAERSVVASIVPMTVWQSEVFLDFIGVFLALIGVIFLLIGVHGFRNTLSFHRRAEEAEGLVTAVRTRSSGTGHDISVVFYPVVEFTTRDGHQVQTETRTGRSPAPAREGDQVTIEYDPEDPASADLAGSWSGLLLYGIFIGMGTLFTVIGIVVQVAMSSFW